MQRNIWKKNQTEIPELKIITTDKMENVLYGPNSVSEITEQQINKFEN